MRRENIRKSQVDVLRKYVVEPTNNVKYMNFCCCRCVIPKLALKLSDVFGLNLLVILVRFAIIDATRVFRCKKSNPYFVQRPSTFLKALVFICETPSCEGTHKNLISKSVFEFAKYHIKT